MRSFSTISFLLSFLLVVTSVSNCSNAKNSKFAYQGTLSIPVSAIQKNESISLEGEWEFYWKKLHNPYTLHSQSTLEKDYISVPSTWNDFVTKNKGSLDGRGYATYRLQIYLDQPYTGELSLKLLSISSAYKLYINGELLKAVGNPADSYDFEDPKYYPDTVDFRLNHSNTIEILFQISNFNHNKGGLWRKVFLGNREVIHHFKNVEVFKDIFLFGGLFILGFYHIVLFFQNKKFLSTLYFGLFCIAIQLRVILTGEMLFTYLLPGFAWNWQIAIEYIDVELIIILSILFIKSIFQEKTHFIIDKVIFTVSILLTLKTLLFPAYEFTKILPVLTVLIFLTILYIFYITYKAILYKKDGAWLVLAGLLVWILTLINDSLLFLGFIQTDIYVHWGFWVLIFLQSIWLSNKFNKAIYEISDLSLELMNRNKVYSKFVPKEFIHFLGKDNITDIQLGNYVQKEVVILFCDIRSFTSLTEKTPVDNLFGFLNNYFTIINDIVIKYSGIIDKYIGDAVLAIFDGQVDDALRCAIEIQLKLKEKPFVIAGKEKYISAGIGLHYGPVLLGVIGGEKLIQTTVIADAVNTASRLQSLTKTYEISIIISDTILHSLDDPGNFMIRFLDHATLAGKEETTFVCEVYDHEEPKQIQLKTTTKREFDYGVMAYHNKDYDNAWNKFREVLNINPQDSAALFYFNRTALYLVKGVSIVKVKEEKLVEWDAEWETGIKSIDEQHKVLFDIINDLYKAIKLNKEIEIFDRIIKNLKMYIFTHFAIEEMLMLKTNYPDFEEHKREHEEFIDKVNILVEKFHLHYEYNSSETLQFLINWLIHHIKKLDKEGYALYVDMT